MTNLRELFLNIATESGYALNCARMAKEGTGADREIYLTLTVAALAKIVAMVDPKPEPATEPEEVAK